jgi:hypothetical protein
MRYWILANVVYVKKPDCREPPNPVKLQFGGLRGEQQTAQAVKVSQKKEEKLRELRQSAALSFWHIRFQLELLQSRTQGLLLQGGILA